MVMFNLFTCGIIAIVVIIIFIFIAIANLLYEKCNSWKYSGWNSIYGEIIAMFVNIFFWISIIVILVYASITIVNGV